MNDTRDFSWEVVKNLGNFSEGRENYRYKNQIEKGC